MGGVLSGARATACGAVLLAVVVLTAAAARADDTNGERIGTKVTTDIGPHRIRLGVGAQVAQVSVTLITDPKVFIDNSEQDLDLIVEWKFPSNRWSPLIGWRTSSVSIDRGRHWQEHLLIGASGLLPPLLWGHVRGQFGTEMVFTTIRHGDGFETEWFSVESDRHVRDLVSINLFLRFDYVTPF